MTPKKARADCLYSPEERNVINKFKEEYRKQQSSQGRAHIFKSKILPAIFNHWTENRRVDMTSAEMATRVKDLGKWLANNWRPYNTVKVSKSSMRITYIDIVWKTRKDVVESEIRRILNLDDAKDPTAAEVFRLRTRAAKAVYERMNDEEKKEISDAIEKFKVTGNDTETRQRLAKRKARKTVKDWSKRSWLEMGLLSFTFYGYIREDGKYDVDVYENTAEAMGVGGAHFMELHKEKAENLLRKFGEYVKDLERMKDHANIMPVPIAPAPAPAANSIGRTANGFPILPEISWMECKKDELEGLMRTYLNIHYRLATGNRIKHVPFSSLAINTTTFVASRYLPDGFVIRDPRNHKKDEIQQFLGHIMKRQVHGAEDAFRFQMYETREHECIAAAYPGNAEHKQHGNKSRKKDTMRERQWSAGAEDDDIAGGDSADYAGDEGASDADNEDGDNDDGEGSDSEDDDDRGVDDTGDMVAGCADHEDLNDTSFKGVKERGDEGTTNPSTTDGSRDFGNPTFTTSMLDQGHLESGMTSQLDHGRMMIVNQSVANTLMAGGINIGPPINGPKDGDPRYMVPAPAPAPAPAQGTTSRATMDKTNSKKLMNVNGGKDLNVPIDPILLSISLDNQNLGTGNDRHNRHVRTSDLLASEEALEFTGGLDGRRRRKPTTRYQT